MDFDELNARIVSCSRCPRLVRYREEVARNPPRRFAGHTYWSRPLPGFGDRSARILVVGLAPAAHGGNRTGRMFTGDSSASFLASTLHQLGLANKPTSESVDDGLVLHDVFLTAPVRCAPPANKPTHDEFENCYPFLLKEARQLSQLRVVVALGAIGFGASVRLLNDLGFRSVAKPKFGHGVEFAFSDDRGMRKFLLGSYHPSRQNTQTGRLTKAMFLSVFRRALELASHS
ncbi:MAG: uracil-DNA glycosylase [Thaumarchaeota archaeon]|nr:uracil-DNA glycosylase [Candidatus Calditenuaceae archaeon]MDW8187535.1 uracil-DNA glycosylase [Nitrososphaerota archaeon]